MENSLLTKMARSSPQVVIGSREDDKAVFVQSRKSFGNLRMILGYRHQQTRGTQLIRSKIAKIRGK